MSTSGRDMESLNRAVEEARRQIWIVVPSHAGPEVRAVAEAVNAAILHLEAAVEARARAEEQERAEFYRRAVADAYVALSTSHIHRESLDAARAALTPAVERSIAEQDARIPVDGGD